uniref:Structural maintenance of chromosomes protein n=1 Tax=Alexandrium monilatum TaxID=311494 RepID=A0A7S4VE94_9DINO|mmetsp:Transcript_101150/g.321195  ORF Transcript_101150/g.321195 Transcript_101150/m.321195 type:complete len:1243 (+) Transcript_101150:62-3790(+)
MDGSASATGRVHEIVVENFKSYQGRVQIGPFRKFTCVIGPNGAGKSNLMDAISFVLGVQARVLRSEKLRDLVYRKEGEDPKKNQRTASVELTYVDEEDPEEETKLVFRRMILRSGEARFQVNSEIVSQADYHKRLEGINILSKVRNFLVFQGDVEATAQRQGKDLTAFFEQISGSEAFRQEYERLAAEKSKKEDNARYLFTKKRNAINEKKRVAQQKDEADSFRRLENERKDLQQEFYLFRLHGISRQLDEAAQKREASTAERESLRAAMESSRHSLERAERERAQAHLAATQADRAIASTRSKLDKVNPERVAARTRIDFLKQRIEDLHTNAEQVERKAGRTQAQLQQLQEEQSKLEGEERVLAENLGQRELHFTKEQREEFERVKRKTERITAAGGDHARQLEHQISALAAERSKAEHDQRESFARKEHLQRRIAELKEAEEAAAKASVQEAQKAEQRAFELQRLQATTDSCAEEKEQLQQERQQLLDTIQDAAATERQIEKEREIAKVCHDLADAVQGVHGRVVDLCQPTQKRLHVAVNVALGKFLDAIIVDTTEAARRCVKYLKERMLPPMTFLPLNDLRVPPLDPRLAELVNDKRTLRLALNCVTFDERYNQAFEFLLGDVVFADTMTDGRNFSFGEARNLGLSCKVVTLHGEAIAKNGNLSVDSGNAREGSTRFDVAELEGTKTRVATIDSRLHEIHALEYNGGADLATLKNEVRRIEAKACESSSHLKWCQEQLRQKQEELQAAESALGALSPEAVRLGQEEERLRKELQGMEAQLGEAVAGHFAKLSAAMGVDDVRKVEREWRREQEAVQLKSEELARRLRNVKAEASMLEQTLQEQASRRPEELAPKLQAEVDELLQKEQGFIKSIEALEEELRGHQTKAKEAFSVERDRDQALQGLRRETKEKRQKITAVEKQLSELNSQEQVLGNSRADILRQSVLEDVEVPLLAGGLQALQDLAEAGSQPASAPTQPGPAPAAAAAGSVAVDFSRLPEEKQAASAGPAAKMLEEEYRSELERLRVELKRLSPNLKAAEQMQGVAEQVQETSREADVARRDIETVEVEFETVRKARRERFMDCFKKVASEIGEVYRRLTANTAGLHSDGGSAYLDLEDTEDPFNGGIKFTAMPPAKRFRDMHLLSGGEKTLAAMALLFAVHAFQRPPFMVLDEVDAALDANNVRALAGYVEQAQCQTIVISLKDRFFIRGEALVGVWKDKPQETSSVLTLDLTRYEQGQVQ